MHTLSVINNATDIHKTMYDVTHAYLTLAEVKNVVHNLSNYISCFTKAVSSKERGLAKALIRSSLP